MPIDNNKLCADCGEHRREFGSLYCRACNYEHKVYDMSQRDSDDQDWEFAFCEECGSALGGDGLCHNTSCGASPDVGEDWL